MNAAFSMHEASSLFYDILLEADWRGMLEIKYCRALDLFFQFVFAYTETRMGFQHDHL